MEEDEYLEAIFRDNLKRELDSEENVIRSLPLPIAVLALCANVLGAIKDSLPPPSLTSYVIAIYVLLVATGIFATFSAWQVGRAVWRRKLIVPPKENDVRTYAANLRTWHASQATGDVDQAVVDDLRSYMIDYCAEAAEHNRAVNIRRSVARANANTWSLATVAAVFVLVGLTLVHGMIVKFEESPHVDEREVRNVQPELPVHPQPGRVGH